MLSVSYITSSCGDNDSRDDEPAEFNPSDLYEQNNELFKKLKGTSWKLEKAEVFNDDGTLRHDNVLRWPYLKGATYTFSDQLSPDIDFESENYTHAYLLYSTAFKGTNYWAIAQDQLYVGMSTDITTASTLIRGFFEAECNHDKLVLKEFNNNKLSGITTLLRVDSYEPPEEDSNNDNTKNYERPEIGLEDYTCNATSITLKYRIYNQEKAEVNQASGYYGTTSSPSRAINADIAGSIITIRVTGLTRNTTYYFKCSAKGKGGTTVSDVVRLITNS